ncbi:hypothetical protein BHE74_00008900 [Ensete ventricosum]|nr:hypothetical protein BHE74_00008900 [Ensete ventricosum]RZR84345.1 hypothetical protein BHM03_00011154 [Ensete ventricosum]
MASASAQSSSCSSAIMSLSPCLDYITGNASTPSSSCCSQLSSVVQSEPQCICTLISSGASSASSLGITVNQTQALALPGACKLPNLVMAWHEMRAVSGPSASPATPSTSPSGVGSKSNPVTSTDSSDGASAGVPLALLLSLVAIATYPFTSLVIV